MLTKRDITTRFKADQWEIQIPRAQGWGALVWVSSELARRWFYSTGRLVAWNGHQSGAEKLTSKKKRGNIIWILNHWISAARVFSLGSEISILSNLVQLLLILVIALDLFLNTEAEQPDGFTTKQVGVRHLCVVLVSWVCVPFCFLRLCELRTAKQQSTSFKVATMVRRPHTSVEFANFL